MATASAASSVHNTLSGTTADLITITDPHDRVEILNRGLSDVFFTIAPEGITPTTAVADADNTTVVPPGMAIVVESPGKRGCTISIVGNGDEYSIQKVTG